MKRLLVAAGVMILFTVSAHAASFEGRWSVVVDCPKAADGAESYTLRLVAQVKDGVLRGQLGAKGSPNSLTIYGKIHSDGVALIDANGVTGFPAYNLKQVARGVPYAYKVTARFELSHGVGNRVEGRVCKYGFTKQ